MTRELRDSGVGWLGDTPAAWSVVPARALFGERKQKSSAIDVHLTPSQKYGVLPQAEYMEITGNKVVLNLSGADNMRHVEAGDYVSHLRSFQGGLEFAGIPGKVSAAYTVLKPKVALEPRFFKYLFKSDLYVQALQTTTDQLRDGQSIRYGQFTLIPLPYPELDEQRAIADYLDRETAQIDAFIAKNEELITLLTERRAATISELVLRGKNSSAPLRESGVEGMGMVPAHWGTQPIVTLARVLTSTVDKKSYPGEFPVRLCNYTDVYYSEVIRSDDGLMEATANRDQITRFSVLAGDVPFTKDSESSDDIGISSYVARDLPGVVYGYHLGIYRPNDTRRSKYIKYLLDTAYVKDYFVRRTPGVTRVGLAQSVIRYLRAPVPPVDEAMAVADEIEHAVGHIDSSLSLVRAGITLARERRAALISAAVTGKIDVGVAA